MRLFVHHSILFLSALCGNLPFFAGAKSAPSLKKEKPSNVCVVQDLSGKRVKVERSALSGPQIFLVVKLGGSYVFWTVADARLLLDRMVTGIKNILVLQQKLLVMHDYLMHRQQQPVDPVGQKKMIGLFKEFSIRPQKLTRFAGWGVALTLPVRGVISDPLSLINDVTDLAIIDAKTGKVHSVRAAVDFKEKTIHQRASGVSDFPFLYRKTPRPRVLQQFSLLKRVFGFVALVGVVITVLKNWSVENEPQTDPNKDPKPDPNPDSDPKPDPKPDPARLKPLRKLAWPNPVAQKPEKPVKPVIQKPAAGTEGDSGQDDEEKSFYRTSNFKRRGKEKIFPLNQPNHRQRREVLMGRLASCWPKQDYENYDAKDAEANEDVWRKVHKTCCHYWLGGKEQGCECDWCQKWKAREARDPRLNIALCCQEPDAMDEEDGDSDDEFEVQPDEEYLDRSSPYLLEKHSQKYLDRDAPPDLVAFFLKTEKGLFPVALLRYQELYDQCTASERQKLDTALGTCGDLGLKCLAIIDDQGVAEVFLAHGLLEEVD